MSSEQHTLNFNSRESQKLAILRYLQSGQKLTPLEALDKFRCMRLGGRIFELKSEGFQIEREMVLTPSGKHVASYRLAEAK